MSPLPSRRRRDEFPNFPSRFPEFSSFPPFPRARSRRGVGICRRLPKSEVEPGLSPGNGKGLVAPVSENPMEKFGIEFQSGEGAEIPKIPQKRAEIPEKMK